MNTLLENILAALLLFGAAVVFLQWRRRTDQSRRVSKAVNTAVRRIAELAPVD